MADRPILRFPEPRDAERRKGGSRPMPRSTDPGSRRQGQRFQATFDRLTNALASADPTIELRQDPGGIAPERALVFETADAVQNLVRAAVEVGLEVIAEFTLDETDEYPEGFRPATGKETFKPELYATIPTIEAFRRLRGFWNAYLRGEAKPHRAAPWWDLFDLLNDIRPWGPEDRFPQGLRTEILENLPDDTDTEVSIEFEIWPTKNFDRREMWRREIEAKLAEIGGRIIDRSSIDEGGWSRGEARWLGPCGHHSVSSPRSSNRTCGFPASGFPTGFTSKHTAVGQDGPDVVGSHRTPRTRPYRGNAWCLATTPCGQFRLRLDVELPPRAPELLGCCQDHRQSPLLAIVKSVPEVRALCSAGITRPHSSYGPVRRPRGPSPKVTSRARPSSPPGLPRLPVSLFQRAVPITPADQDGCTCRLLPRPARPSPYLRRVGIRDFTFEACSGFTRITARWIAQPPKAAFVTGLRSIRLPGQTACQLPDQTDNCLGGSFLH